MITYKKICEKIGFDPIIDGYEYKFSGHEDDTQASPFAVLSDEESDFLFDYLFGNNRPPAPNNN